MCGLLGRAVHLGTLTTYYNIVSFEWAAVAAVGAGSIVVAVIGGMLVGIYHPRENDSAVAEV